MLEESSNFGPFITVIDGVPIKLNVNYQKFEPDFGDPSGRHPYYYHFTGDLLRQKGDFIVNSTSTLCRNYFKNELKNLHFNSIKFGLIKIQDSVTNGTFMFTSSEYQTLLRLPELTGDDLRCAILEFINCVNGKWPQEEIEAEDIRLNYNANINEIDQWLRGLSQEDLLVPNRIDYTANRFSKGHRGIDKYKINQKKREKIASMISRNINSWKDFDVDLNNISNFLKEGESETLEFKGSLELEVKRYLDGDKKRAFEKELRKEVLRSIVGFLNSNENTPRHIVIGILEKDKFVNTSQYREISPNLLLFGINYEYKKGDWDVYKLKLLDLIKNRISDSAFQYLKISRINIDDHDLCLIKVFWPTAFPSKWFYLDKKEFWVRDGNRTRKLEGEAQDDYKEQNPRY